LGNMHHGTEACKVSMRAGRKPERKIKKQVYLAPWML
jgi:hypothetical protein